MSRPWIRLLYQIKVPCLQGGMFATVAAYDCPIQMANTTVKLLASRSFNDIQLSGVLGTIELHASLITAGAWEGYNWGLVDPTGFLAKAVQGRFDRYSGDGLGMV